MASQKKQPSKKAPAKEPKAKEQESALQEETQDQEAPAQEEKPDEQKVGEDSKKQDRKTERVIVILASEDSEFLSRFEISRSAVSRAVIAGCRSYLEREEFKTATEPEIINALAGALQIKLK